MRRRGAAILHKKTRVLASPPRGASPYAAARRSDACLYASSRHPHHQQHQPELLFFRTPQVGPAASWTAPALAGDHGSERKKNGAERKRSSSSFLALLFGGRRRRGREEELNEQRSNKFDHQHQPPRRSTSWISAIVRRKRRPEAGASSLPRPADEEPDSPGASSATTTTSSSWWFPSPSPARNHHHHRRGRPRDNTNGGGDGNGMSGFAVCLSPLVRPGSGGGPRRRCQAAPDLGESHRRHLSAGSGAASFGRNTSRKLADVGRFR